MEALFSTCMTGLQGNLFRQNLGVNQCSKVVMSGFPHYPWLPWKFSRIPRGYWEVSDNRRYYHDWLFKELGFKTMDDWYTISLNNFIEHGGRGYVLLEGSQFNMCRL